MRCLCGWWNRRCLCREGVGRRKELGRAAAAARRVGALVVAGVPACAGMTEGGRDDGGGVVWAIGDARDRWRRRVASHPPPNLPPSRGEG